MELERSAGRAQARGGLAAAAAFLQRAVVLSLDLARRGERALAAAQASLDAGAFDAARGLLITAEEGLLDEFQRARIDLLRAPRCLRGGSWQRCSSAAAERRQAARAVRRRARARDLPNCVAHVVGDGGGSTGGGVLLEICRAVRALPGTPGDPRALDLLLDGLALLILEGHAIATPTLQGAARALADIPVEDVVRWGWMATAASACVWDVEGFHAISARQVQLVRDAGALAHLPFGLNQLGLACAWMGDFAGAESCVAEFDSVATATGSPIAPYALLRLRALQGREAETTAAIETAHELAAAGGQGIARPPRALGSRSPVQRPGPLRRGRVRGRASHPERPQPVVATWPCCRSLSKRPRAQATPRRRTTRSSDWRRRRSPPAPTSRSASKPVPARC